MPGTKKRIALFDADGQRIRGKENKETAERRNQSGREPRKASIRVATVSRARLVLFNNEKLPFGPFLIDVPSRAEKEVEVLDTNSRNPK